MNKFSFGLALRFLLSLVACAWVPAFAACGDAAPSPDCGEVPSALFTNEGRLWVVFADQGYVYLAASDDRGGSFGPATRVNAEAEKIYTDGENRPVLGLGRNGEIFVAWTRDTGAAWSGDIRFARSLDHGTSFDTPRTINDDGLLTSHRFVALRTSRNGELYLAWLDKRDQVAALQAGHDYVGAALYYTLSTDNGASFAANRKVADQSCECCRVALADDGNAAVRAFWRHVFEDGSVRDHASVRLAADGATDFARATWDDWRITGCPHHGPALVAGEDGHHLAWFSNGERQRGVLYGWRDARTGATGRVQVLEDKPAGGHPALLAQGEQVLLAWNHFDGKRMTLKLARSADGGQHWSTPVVLLSTEGAADHPQLLLDGTDAWLGWHTAGEGYRLLALGNAR